MDNKEKRPSHWVYETTVQQNDRLVLSKKMIRSKAFVELTGAAKQILLELRMRLTLECYKPSRPYGKRGDVKSFYAKNNGKLRFTYKQAQKMFEYSSSTISKAIDQLVEKGWIEIVELGCGVQRRSHKFALIKNWEQYDTPEFKPGKGKADMPVNKGFRKRKDLQTTLETKEGKTLETKDVQGPDPQKSA
ncbi:MAG: hypothetical protein ACYS30_19450 [Planctomycetota bacterium]|jgi:hypothetical protein